MNSNEPSSSSSSSNTPSLTDIASSSSTLPLSQHRPLKRTADQVGLESSGQPLPDAKRVKQAREGEVPHSGMQHEDEMEDVDSRRVDEQLLMQMDGVVVEGEREQQEVVAKSKSDDKEGGEEDARVMAVKGNNVEVDKALKYAEDMEDELRCGCCTGLLYRPVVVTPCGHYFCGSCCVLWVRNGGTSCPACRQPSTSVSPSRLLEGFIQILLQTYPERQRTQAERDQADEVYQLSMGISIPPPRPANSEGALLPQSRSHDPPPDNLARPCPHCLPNNEFGWRCPRPLADPTTDPTQAWNLDNGTPPGHAWCGYCDELHAVGSPSTSRCSICTTSFCGLSVPSLCVANHMSSAMLPVAVSNLTGIIQSQDVYEAFLGNATEVEVLFDWLRDDGRGPRGMLLDMIEKIRSTPDGFQTLIEQGVFIRNDEDGMRTPPSPMANVNANQNANNNTLPIDPASAIGEDEDDDDDDDDDDDGDDEPIMVDASIVIPVVPQEAVSVPAPLANGSPVPENMAAPPALVIPESDPQLPEDVIEQVRSAPVDAPVPVPPGVAPIPQPAPAAIPARTFSRICRECAHSLFITRLYDWWAGERAEVVASYEEMQANKLIDDAQMKDSDKEGVVEGGSEVATGDAVEPSVVPADEAAGVGQDVDEKFEGLPLWVLDGAKRKDCELGRQCGRQYETSHAKEFNHIIAPPRPVPPPRLHTENTTGDSIPANVAQVPTDAVGTGSAAEPPTDSNILVVDDDDDDGENDHDVRMEDVPDLSIMLAAANAANGTSLHGDVEMSPPNAPEHVAAGPSSFSNASSSAGAPAVSPSVSRRSSKGVGPQHDRTTHYREADQDAAMEDVDRDAIAVERSLETSSRTTSSSGIGASGGVNGFPSQAQEATA
ncbi:hypothetical protein FRB97_006725 [Tulasnella sp. 331]|nr:hypothetical protein FRB97_006725 [Tulasnella sp. 331]KAG8877415.1 hypothetical protein FRB98_006697 [Tulasnella sp. 332]